MSSPRTRGPITPVVCCEGRLLIPAFRREAAAYGSPRARGRRLPPPEIRDPALGGGLDAFLEILGGAQPVLFDQFMVGGGQHAVGEAGAHGGAGRDQAK